MENSVGVNEYLCDSCGFTYRSIDFEGLDLSEQPEDFVCPTCQSSKSHFQIDQQSGNEDLSQDSSENGQETNAPFDVEPDTNGHNTRRIQVGTSDPSVGSLKDRKVDGYLDTQPDYQRYEVWTPTKKSRLIESVLMNLPLPRLYFAENDDETEEVVDGQQRLSALFRYMDDEYPLTGLRAETQLNGKSWSDLDKKIQNRIKNFALSTVVIKKESDPALRFDLFERLNTGATGLNEQELRNAVYRGEYNNFIYRLAENEDWRKLHRIKGPHKRMADAEWVLRFMAFQDQTYLNFPDKRMTKFLNKQMEVNHPIITSDLKQREQLFKQAASLCLSVFGDKAFCRFRRGDEEEVNGRWESRRIRALEDVQLWGMTQFNKGQLIGKADEVFEASLQITSIPEFSDLIVENTSGKERVAKRFVLWKHMLDEVLEGSEQGTRFFPRKVREDLWEQDRTCAVCSQEIRVFDDAHVDHVVPYAKGGKTIKENAQIAHRYCNQVKSSK